MERQHIHLALATPSSSAAAGPSPSASSLEAGLLQDELKKIVSGIRPSSDLYIYLDVPLLLARPSSPSPSFPNHRRLCSPHAPFLASQTMSLCSSPPTRSSFRPAIRRRLASSVVSTSCERPGRMAASCGTGRAFKVLSHRHDRGSAGPTDRFAKGTSSRSGHEIRGQQMQNAGE